MKKIISTTALSTLLFCGGFASSSVLAQESTLQPTADWKISSLGQGAQQYCALSRSYEEGLVLTMGQNLGKEYSLAIDFQDSSLNTTQPYKVALQPGPGQVRAYQLRAASQRALVIRIGDDNDFVKALEQSGEMKAQINGQNYNFAVSDFPQAKSQLEECMAKIGNTPVKMASNVEVPKAEKVATEKNVTPKPEAADKPKEEQAVVKPPRKVEKPVAMKKEEPVKTAMAEIDDKPVETPEPIIMKKEAAAPAPKVEKVVAEAVEVEKKIVEAPAKAIKVDEKPAPKSTDTKMKVSRYEPTETAEIDPEVIAARSNISSKRVSIDNETGAIRPSILTERPPLPSTTSKTQKAEAKPIPKPEVISSRVVEEPKPIALQEMSKQPVIEDKAEKVEKVDVKKPVISPPEQKLAAVSEMKQDAKQVSRTTNKRPVVWNDTLEKKQQDELERIKAENKRLNEALRAQIKNPMTASTDPKDEDTQVAELRAQVAKLESELAKKPEGEGFVSPEMQAEINMLRAENKKLVGSLSSQETKMDDFDAASPTALKELEVMREEVELLKKQNERLSKEALRANSQIDGARMDAGNTALEKIKDYERRLEAAKEDNLMLSREIEVMKNKKDAVALAAASGDWNLEKATRRYNEAEREINRLGMLLEQQRSSHRDEKAQLEQMLFDPAVTDKQQRRRLAELEAKLIAAERQLEAAGRAVPRDRYDGSLARLEAPQQPQRVVQAPIVQAAPPPKLYDTYHTPFPNAKAPVAPVARQEIQPMPRPPMVKDRKVAAQSPVDDVYKSAMQPVPSQTQSSQIGMSDIQQLLTASNIRPTNVRQGTNGQYQWRAGNVNGMAELGSKSRYGDVNQFAQQYISKAKQSCSGDFASSEAASSGRFKSYDIVCVGGAQNKASSVVFVEKDGSIMAISHIGGTDNLDTAIDLRDRVAGTL